MWPPDQEDLCHADCLCPLPQSAHCHTKTDFCPIDLRSSQMIIMQHKQRHHLIDKYVGLPATTEPKPKPDNLSPFLAQFYLSN